MCIRDRLQVLGRRLRRSGLSRAVGTGPPWAAGQLLGGAGAAGRGPVVLVIGIETSCDETAVALVEDGLRVRSNVIGSQVEQHRPYGGVVPEIAARAHLDLLVPALDRALVEGGCTYADVDAVAVTVGPGLVGALLVGVAAAKSLALGRDLPLIGVNHLEGHVYAAQLEYGQLQPPLVA